MASDISTALRAVMTQLDLSSTDMATLLGCSRQSIHRWTAGHLAEGLQEAVVLDVADALASEPDDVLERWRLQVRAELKRHVRASAGLLRALILPPSTVVFRLVAHGDDLLMVAVGARGADMPIYHGETTDRSRARWTLDGAVFRYAGQEEPTEEADGTRLVPPRPGMVGRFSVDRVESAGETAAIHAVTSGLPPKKVEAERDRATRAAARRRERASKEDLRKTKIARGDPLCTCPPHIRSTKPLVLRRATEDPTVDMAVCGICSRRVVR